MVDKIKEGRSVVKWQTLWAITGPKMPRSDIRLLDCMHLGPMNDEVFEYLKGETTPVPKITPASECYIVNHLPRTVVQSRYRLQVDSTAESEEDAVRECTKLVGKLLTSLRLSVPDTPYHAELRKIRSTEEGKDHSPWAYIKFSTLSTVEEIMEDDLLNVSNIFSTISTDDAAENSHVHLLTAWTLQDGGSHELLGRSILQHYVLCIEAVVKRIASTVREANRDKIRLEERKFASQFADGFSVSSDKPNAIRTASTQLRNISLENMMPSIDETCNLLGIKAEIADEAKELYRFRSKTISHPGRVEDGVLNEWLSKEPEISSYCRADVVARTFLNAYCAYLVKDPRHGKGLAARASVN